MLEGDAKGKTHRYLHGNVSLKEAKVTDPSIEDAANVPSAANTGAIASTAATGADVKPEEATGATTAENMWAAFDA